MARPRGIPFQPGNHFGRGRPEGSRNKASLLAQQLVDDHSGPILSKCLIRAAQGDPVALRLIVERILPAKRDNRVQLRMPVIRSAADLANAAQCVFRAVSSGKISTEQGNALLDIIDKYRRVLETQDQEQRLRGLEQALSRLPALKTPKSSEEDENE
jgi:hypothetical protein